MATQLSPRLRGQEVQIAIMTNGYQESTINAIASFEETFKLEKKEDGFLGETTHRYDHIYNGIDGKVEFQVSTADWMLFQNAIKRQAQRFQVNTQINMIRTDNYADGTQVVVTYIDCKFGPSPTSVSGRNEFVKVSLDFSASDRDEQIS